MEEVGSSSLPGSTSSDLHIPPEIKKVTQALNEAGFASYIVGGCVRDLVMKRKPKDWDVTTDATPEKIQEIFPENVYENIFGTVGVRTGSDDPALKEVQITPYRIEGRYSDKRRPEFVKFVRNLDDDLSRRDFTINAMAMDAFGNIIDPFNGQGDIKNKIIRTVGQPSERFDEDALRLMRAVRFATTLGFSIEPATLEAIEKNTQWLKAISQERVRDELVKILESDHAYQGLLLLESSGLLKHILPELREGIGVTQNLHHIYTVWEHCLLALKYTVEKKYPLIVRMAALFHDIGKPRSKRGEGLHSTFYGHDVIGAKMVAQLMARLKFPNEITEQVVRLVRYHMFYYNVGEVTESSVRRLIANVGIEATEDLIKVREADRIGSGRPKAVPYKIRHLKYLIDKVSHDPISVKMLKVNGEDIMTELDLKPGPKIGIILNTLLAEALDNPELNTKEKLIERARELSSHTVEDLKKALAKIEVARQAEEEERMKKFYV